MQSERSYSVWAPNGTPTERSPTGQEFYVQVASRNTENIRKWTVESLYRDLCPVWKPALPGGPCLFSSENNPQ